MPTVAAHQIPATCIESAGRCLFFNFGMLFAPWLACHALSRSEQDGPMEPKIALFFLLIASVIGLSHLNDDVVGRMRRQLGEGRWREILPRRRRV
ncbi:MAG: hypothetical protein WB769_02565 [Pseudolabrys sp.]